MNRQLPEGVVPSGALIVPTGIGERMIGDGPKVRDRRLLVFHIASSPPASALIPVRLSLPVVGRLETPGETLAAVHAPVNQPHGLFRPPFAASHEGSLVLVGLLQARVVLIRPATYPPHSPGRSDDLAHKMSLADSLLEVGMDDAGRDHLGRWRRSVAPGPGLIHRVAEAVGRMTPDIQELGAAIPTSRQVRRRKRDEKSAA